MPTKKANHQKNPMQQSWYTRQAKRQNAKDKVKAKELAERLGKRREYRLQFREYNKEERETNNCKTEHCRTLASNPKYLGYCFRCFLYTFPDIPNTMNYKIKEQRLQEFIADNYPELEITFDKTTGGCSRRRPDCLIEMYTHTIIVECDENQHASYDSTCEMVRINELFTDLADRPMVIIKFNPDGYMGKGAEYVSSPFRYHKSLGVPIVDNKEEWESRLDTLKDEIDSHVRHIPDCPVKIVELFYDCDED